MAGGPPGAQGVVQQEFDHIVFGEELGHRADGAGADLLLAVVHLLFLLALPELIHPAQTIIGGEHRCGQVVDDAFQGVTALGREAHLHCGVIQGKEAGQHGCGVAGGQVPGIGGALLRGQFRTVLQGDGHACFGMDEEVVFGQEAGEQHPVPLLIGDLLHQQVPAHTDAALPDETAAEKGGPGPQRHPQPALLLAHRGIGLGLLHGQGDQDRCGCVLCDPAGADDGSFQLSA